MIWPPPQSCKIIWMAYIRDTVFILKSEPYREQDARVVMYGKNHGKLVAVARGVRKIGAKQLGHLEPFSRAEVMIAVGSAFDKLAVARTLLPMEGLRRNLAAMAVLGPFADLLEQLTRPGVADDQIFDLFEELVSVWDPSLREPSIERSRMILSCACLRLLDLLGEAPDLEALSFREQPEGTKTLMTFMRMRPLRDVLSVTAPSDVFTSASMMIEYAVQRSPLVGRMHGQAMLEALLA